MIKMLLSVWVFITAITPSFAIITPSFAIDPGVAEGVLRINNESIELKHAYAHEYDNEDGLGEGPELRILLSDREVPQTLLSGFNAGFKLDSMARNGRIRGVLLRLDPVNLNTLLNGTILYPPDNPQNSLVSFTKTGTEEFQNIEMKNNRVMGKVKDERDAQSEDMPAYEFSASFSAPLFHDEPISARLSGEEAVKSPQAQTILECEEAMRNWNLEKVKTLVSPEKFDEFQGQIARLGDDTVKDMAKQMIPNRATREQQVKQVIVRGSQAVVVMEEEGSKEFIPLRQVKGKWIVD